MTLIERLRAQASKEANELADLLNEAAEALAQPQPEPVAVVVAREYDDGSFAGHQLEWRGNNEEDDLPVGAKLYTYPPAQQEPVGEVTDAVGNAFKCEFNGPLSVGTKLYTSPPARKPLTQQQIVDLCDGTLTTWEQVRIARAIEEAHGIKDES